jgi:enterochelin esterase family protein
MKILIARCFLALAVLCAPAMAQDWTVARPGVPTGRLEQFNLPAHSYPNPRRVWVYTPAGYDPARKPAYDLLVAFDGDGYREDIPLPTVLDNLIADKKLPPMVALLIDNGDGLARRQDLANASKFADFLGGEVIPWVRGRWNVTADPKRTIVTGSSAGGLGAAYVAYKRPDLFGNVLSQSGAFWRGNEASDGPPYEWLTAQFKASPKLPITFYLEVGALETHHAVGTGPVFIEANRRLRDVLQAKGYPLHYEEVPGAQHEPGHWKNKLADGLLWLTRDWK